MADTARLRRALLLLPATLLLSAPVAAYAAPAGTPPTALPVVVGHEDGEHEHPEAFTAPTATPAATFPASPGDHEHAEGEDDHDAEPAVEDHSRHGAEPADDAHSDHGAEPATQDDHDDAGAGGGGHDDGHGTAEGPAPERPLAAVLATFAGVNGAVLVTATVLRRRDRARPRHRPRAGTTRSPA